MDLTRYRKAAGLSMTQLARIAGVDLATISRLESGDQRVASYEITCRLAIALGFANPLDFEPVEISTDYVLEPRRIRRVS